MVSSERFASTSSVLDAATERGNVRSGGAEKDECNAVDSGNICPEALASPVHLTSLSSVRYQLAETHSAGGADEKVFTSGTLFETPTRNQICNWFSPLKQSDVNCLSVLSPGFPTSFNTEGTEADNCDLLLSPTAFQFFSPPRGNISSTSTPLRVPELLSSPTLDSSLTFSNALCNMTVSPESKVRCEVKENNAELSEVSRARQNLSHVQGDVKGDCTTAKQPLTADIKPTIDSKQPSQAIQNDLKETAPHASTKKCRCKKTKCLKLYCDCFAAKERCGPECGCVGCENTADNSDRVEEAVKTTLDRNPKAFNPKIEMCSSGLKTVRVGGGKVRLSCDHSIH